MQQMQVKEVQRFEVNGELFQTREEALKYIAQRKRDKVMYFVKDGNVLETLNQMVKQGITNKNKIQSLIKDIEKELGNI